jgi:hypothetical protein
MMDAWGAALRDWDEAIADCTAVAVAAAAGGGGGGGGGAAAGPELALYTHYSGLATQQLGDWAGAAVRLRRAVELGCPKSAAALQRLLERAVDTRGETVAQSSPPPPTHTTGGRVDGAVAAAAAAADEASVAVRRHAAAAAAEARETEARRQPTSAAAAAATSAEPLPSPLLLRTADGSYTLRIKMIDHTEVAVPDISCATTVAELRERLAARGVAIKFLALAGAAIIPGVDESRTMADIGVRPAGPRLVCVPLQPGGSQPPVVQ